MMTILAEIQAKIRANTFEFSEHAVTQSILRGISVQEVREVCETAEIIEDYPLDKYGPSLILLGFTTSHRPLHVQCSLVQSSRLSLSTSQIR